MKKETFLRILVSAALLLALAAGLTQAQGPAPQRGTVPQAAVGTTITYQGQLNRGGSAVNDTCEMTFGLYDDGAAGSLVGGPLTQTVAISNGLFTVPLDFPDAFTGAARWLEIAVRCTGDPGYTTLSPRQELSAAPYALSLRPGAVVSGEVYDGDVLAVVNSSSAGNGLSGKSFANGGRGVYGLAGATSTKTYGVYGQADSTDGRGVYGYASAASGQTVGVYGETASTQGAGVYGHSQLSSGTVYGVRGYVYSTDGYGVAGLAIAGSGATRGVWGHVESPAGRGVYGNNSAASGPAYGVYGRSDSTDGRGVHGYASAASGGSCGVYGESDSTTGTGVLGYASADSGGTIGVYGQSDSASGCGVYGQAVASNGDYGLYSFGNTGATGTKSAIVETADYAWRHLYSMESPDVLFEDVGTAQLRDGVALVPIEPVFAQTVNLSRPYQVFLTPQGDCGLYVAEKTTASFTVRALDGRACNLSFDYRIVAKRLGFEDVRLAPAQDPLSVRGTVGPLQAGEVRP